ncbi:MAG TPA: rod shape-determining protein MreC [Gaiellaceae bacterium]|nr:rod shape-determining protein MreC [Gaiellaceae bacterium]
MATRSRSARAAALASSVQRSKPTPYPSKARSAFVRRSVLAALVLAALTLLTISFRSPTAGALHDLQGVGSSILRPFQIAGTRVAQPFRDAYDYFDSLANAKSENERLRQELATYRSTQLLNAEKAQEYEQLVKLMHYHQGSTFPNGYRAVNARVISFSASAFAHTLAIAAGSSSGITVNSPVVNGDGLVGRVSNVFSDTAIVTLLSDPNSYVAARDLHTGVQGLVHTGPGGTLILDDVSKQLVVSPGDTIVTNGTRDPRYPDLYPFGIPIGKVPVGGVSVTDTAAFLQVQVQPFANLGSLDSVAVLVKAKSKR